MHIGDPIPGYYVQTGFGAYEGHRGADFPAPEGTPILAAHDGVVRMAGWLGGAYQPGGNLVYLTAHDNSYETSYQHMVSAPIVSVGQHVSAGQVIGYVGSTGYTTGPHLHLELWLGGPAWSPGSTAVDPIPYIQVDAPLAGNQRKVGDSQIIRRAEPSTSSAALEPALEPGEVGNFDGWKHGEDVAGNNVWFRGVSGNWFWSGGFTDQGTHDLADLNPAPPAPPIPQPEPTPQPEPANPDQALLENTAALKTLTETLKNIFKAG